MEIKKHICFRSKQDLELTDFLIQNNIPFQEGEIISSLDIFESSPYWPFIAEYLIKRKLICLSETVFTKNELSKAEWLTVRSQWRCGYPQPEGAFAYETITYTRRDHCNECGSGLVQVNAFRIKKPPKWGKRHFMMLNWVEDEIFVSDIAKNVLLCESVTGISFREVEDKKGAEIYTDVSQLVVSSVLSEGVIEERRSVDEAPICPHCGIKKYHPTGIGMLAFHKGIFENAPDIVKSGEIFGWGHGASRVILVRQNVYQLIIANHLECGLVFEPIELI